jgi:hypothetical protein
LSAVRTFSPLGVKMCRYRVDIIVVLEGYYKVLNVEFFSM